MRVAVKGVEIEMTVAEAKEAGVFEFMVDTVQSDLLLKAIQPAKNLVPKETKPKATKRAFANRRTPIEMLAARQVEAKKINKLRAQLAAASSSTSPIDLHAVKGNHTSFQFHNTLLGDSQKTVLFYRVPTSPASGLSAYTQMVGAAESRGYSYSGYKVTEYADGTSLYRGEFNKI